MSTAPVVQFIKADHRGQLDEDIGGFQARADQLREDWTDPHGDPDDPGVRSASRGKYKPVEEAAHPLVDHARNLGESGDKAYEQAAQAQPDGAGGHKCTLADCRTPKL